MLLRTLLFPVDNGIGKGLSGDGISAEYDLWTGKVTWRQASQQTIKQQQKLTSNLLVIASLLSPLTVTGLLMLSRHFSILKQSLSLKIERLAPIILGLVLFLAFEALMLAIRLRDPIAEVEPSPARQHDYFMEMFDFAIRRNIGSDRMPPYLMTYLSSCLALACLPLAYYVYLHPSEFTDVDYGPLAPLLMTSILFSLVPNLLWNLILKHIIYLKLLRQTKGK